MACSANSGATSAAGPKVMIEYDDAARNADDSQSYSEMRKMMAFRTIAMTPV